MQVEILTYAPTEFYHCQHCEIVWDSVGVFKAIRYRARRFPAFVLDGGERIIGFDRQRLDAALAQRLI